MTAYLLILAAVCIFFFGIGFFYGKTGATRHQRKLRGY